MYTCSYSFGGSLEIYSNTILSDISGLKNLQAGSIGNLKINNNATLSNCAVESICDFLKSPNGTVEIHENAQGCNSQEEVQAACSMEIYERAVGGQQSAVECFPNPFHSSIEFLVSGIEFQGAILKIHNSQGQEVATLLDETLPAGEQTISWDATGLPAGVYYYVLTTDDRRLTTGKLVKY